MPLIDLPDGSQLDLPDDATPEMRNAVRAKLASSYATASPGQKLWSAVKDVGSNLQSGATDLVRGAGKSLAGMAEGAAAFNDTDRPNWAKPSSVPQYNELTQGVNEALPTPPGATPGRQYLRAGLEGLGGAAVSGPPNPVGLVSGITGGVAGQAADNMAPGNPLAKFAATVLGGVAGGTATGLATRLRPQTASIAKEAVEGVTEAELRAAQQYQAQMSAKGTDLDLSQAVKAVTGRETNLTNIRNYVANRSQGNATQEMLRNQPGQIGREGQLTVENLAGDNWSMRQNANNLQQTATELITGVKKQRTQLWEDTVQQGVAALKASEGAKVQQAKEFAEATGLTVAQARSKVNQLVTELASGKASDAKSVAGLNKRVEDMQETIKALQTFTLPRGATTTNRGNYSDLPQRGQSIINDSASREGRAAFLGKDLPPTVESAPSMATLQIQKALEGAKGELSASQLAQQKAQEGLRTAHEGFNSTERVPAAVLEGVQGKLQQLIAKYPNSVEASELGGLLGKLSTAEGPLTDPAQINRILTQFTTRLKSPDLKTAGMDAGTSKYLGQVVGSLREDLGQGFSPIRNANTAYRNFTNDVVSPLRQGPVGTIAQPHGYNPEVPGMVSKFDGLMNAGTDPNAKVSDIRDLVKELGKVDPAAVESSFKGWVSRKFASAMDSPIEAGAASANPDIAKRTYDAFFKPAAQWQGVVDATAEMAKLRGQRPEEVIRGLENYKKLVIAASSQPPLKGGLSPQDIQLQGGNSQLANAVRVFSFLPANRLGEGIERATLGKTLAQFDTILTSPQGADMLIKLGKVPVMSKAAQTILGTWGVATENTGGLNGDNTGY